jgi:hypothetical protein
MEISFKDLPIGQYSEEIWRKQWPNVTKPRGITEGRLSIEEIDQEHVLCVTCLKDQTGPETGGTSWGARFDKSYNEATVEYKVRINPDFDYKRGGKLPGFCGGSGPMGGRNTTDGFSARVMWRELGMLTQYVYFPDKDATKQWGQDFIWTKAENKQVPITSEMWKRWDILKEIDKDRAYFTPDVWHTIKTEIIMNTPDKEDGKLISWFDGEEVCNLTLQFIKDLTFGIDSFKFSVFFGGNDPTWAPDKDEKIYFKDFNFSL